MRMFARTIFAFSFAMCGSASAQDRAANKMADPPSTDVQIYRMIRDADHPGRVGTKFSTRAPFLWVQQELIGIMPPRYRVVFGYRAGANGANRDAQIMCSSSNREAPWKSGTPVTVEGVIERADVGFHIWLDHCTYRDPGEE
jgi:hypothetical protein